jgi:hypothetical protein
MRQARLDSVRVTALNIGISFYTPLGTPYSEHPFMSWGSLLIDLTESDRPISSNLTGRSQSK